MRNKLSFFKRLNKIGITILFISSILFACKSPKVVESERVALEKVNKEERLNRIIQSAIEYNTLSSNLKFTFSTASKEQSVDAQLKIKKDEAIQLSFRVPILGEVFKTIITPTEIIIIDRIHKQYLHESMNNMKGKVPFEFDYYSLEALFTNQLFIAGKKEIQRKDYPSFGIIEDNYLVRITNIDKQNIQYDFITDFTNRIQQTQMSQVKWDSQLLCNYTNWGLTSNKKDFPMTMKFTLLIPNSSYDVNLGFKSVDINTNFTIDHKIPEKYKQITSQQVINVIKRLL